ncbi:NAD(P)H-dependent flavin oxidoreductase [Thermodesulfobacteriota bacterium]
MKTRITELLKIEHPIIQGAVYPVSSLPSLVGAVSNAGGLGILAAARLNPIELQTTIRKVKELSDKPFGVNLIPDNPHLEDLLNIMIEEGISVFSYGIGNPEHIVEKALSAGLIGMPTVGSVAQAVKAERDGAQAIIVQGEEGGGHASNVSSMVLTPLAVDRVKIPVVLAGGVGDARGLVAAFALGAEAISMGSRFLVTKESPAHSAAKKKILESCEKDTVISTSVTGIRGRMLKNKGIDTYTELSTRDREKLLSGLSKFDLGYLVGDTDNGFLPIGQVCGMIDDEPTCKELIDRIIKDAEKIIDSICLFRRAFPAHKS